MSLLKSECMHFVKKKLNPVCCSRDLHLSNPRNVKKFKDIPGPVSLPIIGTLYQYLPLIGPYSFKTLHLNGLKKYQQYGRIVRERIAPGINIVWLFDPDDVEVLSRNEGIYPSRRSHVALGKYRLANKDVYNSKAGLLPTNGKDWYEQRKIFQRGLTSPTAVVNFISDVDVIIKEFLNIIEEGDLKKYRAHKNFLPLLSRLFLEITCQCMLDYKIECFSDDHLRADSESSLLIWSAFTTNSCVLKLDNGLMLWRFFETPSYMRMKRAQEILEGFAADRLHVKVSMYDDTIRPHKTLLETYLASTELELIDLVGIICDFLLAGIDTTSYSTAFILYHLAKSPEVQEKLFDEALFLLPDIDTPITKEILANARYTKAVVKESLRLRPVAVGVGRVLDKDIVLSGYNVPKGTNIVTQNQIISRLETYFDRPDEFLPERWMVEKDDPNYRRYHPFAVLPFGHGSRSCIARRFAEQNMTMLTLRAARMFRFEWFGRELDTKSYLINKPDGPIALKFIRR